MLKYLALILSCFPCLLNAQIYTRTGTLDMRIGESSGLEALSGDRFITLNDGGNKPELFTIDSSGEVLGVMTINGFPNSDWESVCSDASGGFYIGDFGNNGNDRTDLRIGKLSAAQIEADTATPLIIHFRYPDQHAFPPPASKRQYDCEAMVHYGDSIYLFTKNRTDPFDGICRMYVLPDIPGTYVAELVDSFHIDQPALLGQVTGAALLGKKLILLGYAHIWISSFVKVPRFNEVREIQLGTLAQREGICVTGSGGIYFTEERLGSDAGIYRLLDASVLSVEQPGESLIVKVKDRQMHISDPGNKIDHVSLFSTNGQIMADIPAHGSDRVLIFSESLKHWENGLLSFMFIRVRYSSGSVTYRRIGSNVR